MKRLVLLLAFLAVALLPATVLAQGKKGYPRMCCDNATDPNACEWETCAEMRAGTSAVTPNYFRLVDGDNPALVLDLSRPQYLIGGLTNLNMNLAGTFSLMMAMDNATANTWEFPTLSVPSNQLTPLWLFNTNAMLGYWDEGTGTYWRAWGGDYSADNLAATTVHGPWMNAALWGLDSTGAVSRLRLDASFRLITSIQDPLDANGNVMTGIYDAGGDGLLINATGEADVDLEMVDGNAVGAGSGATTAGTLRTVLATDSPGVATAAPAYGRIQDGDSTVLADVLDTSTGSTIASTLNGVVADVRLRGWDGSAWAPALIGAYGGLGVEVLNYPNSYDAGNAWNATFKKDIGILNYALAGTAVDDAGTDVICASTYVLNTPNWTVWAKNAGGGSGDAFAGVDVQVSYDGTDWSESLTSTACDTLASGASAMCYTGSNLSYAYVRVVANTAAADDTTGDCWIQGNKN